jgi:hypothetical protein
MMRLQLEHDNTKEIRYTTKEIRDCHVHADTTSALEETAEATSQALWLVVRSSLVL